MNQEEKRKYYENEEIEDYAIHTRRKEPLPITCQHVRQDGSNSNSIARAQNDNMGYQFQWAIPDHPALTTEEATTMSSTVSSLDSLLEMTERSEMFAFRENNSQRDSDSS